MLNGAGWLAGNCPVSAPDCEEKKEEEEEAGAATELGHLPGGKCCITVRSPLLLFLPSDFAASSSSSS